jgi:hypothetical protein
MVKMGMGTSDFNYITPAFLLRANFFDETRVTTTWKAGIPFHQHKFFLRKMQHF